MICCGGTPTEIGDVCGHHAPQLRKALERAEKAEKEAELVKSQVEEWQSRIRTTGHDGAFEIVEAFNSLKARIAELGKPVTDEELSFWNSSLGFPEERLNAFISYRLSRQPKASQPEESHGRH